MIVVYLKNGEKAPMPDADSVRREPDTGGTGVLLRCFYGKQEVGQFRYEEVAGYTIEATQGLADQNASPEPWFRRLES